MGINGCEIIKNYKLDDFLEEEVKLGDNESTLRKKYIEYNSKFPKQMTEVEFINKFKKCKRPNHSQNCLRNENKGDDKNNISNLINDKNFYEKLNLDKKIFDRKKSDEYNINQEKNNDIYNNNDDLIIINPKNHMFFDSCNNDITDDYTIKNETIVYNIENSKDNNKLYSTLRKVQEENNNCIKENKIEVNQNKLNNKNKNYQKNINNKSNDSKKCNNKIKTKKVNLNPYIQKTNEEINDDININSNNVNKNNIKYNEENSRKKISKNKKEKIAKKQNDINRKSYKNKSINKINNNRNQISNKKYLSPLSNNINNNNNNRIQQALTLENKNLLLNNIFLNQLPLFKKEEILPNFERKTYQEDLIIFKDQNIEKEKLFSEPNKRLIYFNQLYDSPKYYLLNNNRIKNNPEKLSDIFYNQKNDKNNQQNSNKKSRSPENIYTNNNNNISVYRKGTDFYLGNKSYNNHYPNYNYLNNNDNNSFFSLFNNSTNLSINFINKANKGSNSAKNSKKVVSFLNKINNISGDNIYKNISFNGNNNLGNPFLNYNRFYSKFSLSKKNINNKANKTKNSEISNSKSYNNILANKKNKLKQNKVKNMNYSMNLLSQQQYKNLVEVYIPKNKQTLINDEIIKNAIGNKFIFSYKKIDNYDLDKILYDGIVYKVIDNMENDDNKGNVKYELLDRYFQITKNCFKYYNDINEAINEKDKPLVQFDIRYIKSIEKININFLNDYKIKGNKNIEIIFCIYINQNDDFFVFAHNNIYIGNSIINILLFLRGYYEDE